jgi:hypothetical protein
LGKVYLLPVEYRVLLAKFLLLYLLGALRWGKEEILVLLHPEVGLSGIIIRIISSTIAR